MSGIFTAKDIRWLKVVRIVALAAFLPLGWYAREHLGNLAVILLSISGGLGVFAGGATIAIDVGALVRGDADYSGGRY